MASVAVILVIFILSILVMLLFAVLKPTVSFCSRAAGSEGDASPAETASVVADSASAPAPLAEEPLRASAPREMEEALVESRPTVILQSKTPIDEKAPAARSGGFTLETFFLGPLLGAIVCLAAQTIPFRAAMEGLWSFAGLNPVGIMILFFAMVYISKFLDATGFFEFCALLAVSKSRGNGTKLYFIIYATVSVLTMFTSNDIVVLTFTPFIHHFAELVHIDPVPFLFGEFFAANTWSMVFIFGNPTNVVIGSAFRVSFADFAVNMVAPTVAGGLVSCGLLYCIFRQSIRRPFDQPESCDPKAAIRNRTDMIVASVFMVASIVLMAVSSAPSFPIEMWHAAGIMAAALLLYNIATDVVRHTRVLVDILASLPWAIVPFLPALFILVNALDHNGVLSAIGRALAPVTRSKSLCFLVFGLLSTVFADVLNNIPMSVSFVPIIAAASQPFSKAALYASVMGSNLGANLTPLGALAGIMWLRILRDYGIDLGFLRFMKVGFIVTPVAVLATTAVWALIFGW